MTHLGVYYAPEHTIPADIDYIKKLQPPVIRLFDNPDVQQMADIHALAPGAVICPRTWSIDDGSDRDHPSKQVNRINADPVGTAHDHAQQYRAQLDRWKLEASQRGLSLPDDQHIYFNSANEPNQGGELNKIATYAVAFLERCTELGLRATAPCLGVGWPDNTGPGTPVDWSAYAKAGLEQAIKRGGHWLELHEYFFKTGPQDTWTWWAGRHLQCPLDVPILLGEVGMDNLVADNRWDKEHDNRGWQGNATPDEYADMIQWHISHSDTRVVAALIFITDIRNREWESFNTRAAHGALLARKDAMVPQTKPMTSGTPAPPPPPTTPVPATTPKTAYVAVPSGANLRKAPRVDGDLITAIPYGEQILVYPDDTGKNWSVVEYQGNTGYMSSALYTFAKPTPQANPGPTPPVKPTEPVKPPTPTPTSGALDPRVLEAVLQVESGGNGFGADGRLKIRFEAHIFKQYLPHDQPIWNAYFRTDAERPWMNQEWRNSLQGQWRPIHTGKQEDEYAAFEFARGLNAPGAYNAISMGAAQTMGFNHARLGYPSAVAMFDAFQRSVDAQLIAFINYMLSDPALVAAIRSKDWAAITKGYNGAGNVEEASAKYKAAYDSLGAT